MIEMYGQAASAFVLAHEYSHHLLGHTATDGRNKPISGMTYLESRLGDDIELSYRARAHSRAEREEFEADASATCILLDVDRDDPWGAGVYSAGSCAVAMLALDQIADLAPQPNLPHGVPDSHPSFSDRLLSTAEIISQLSTEHIDGPMYDERIGRELSRRPEGFILQLLGLAPVLSLARSRVR